MCRYGVSTGELLPIELGGGLGSLRPCSPHNSRQLSAEHHHSERSATEWPAHDGVNDASRSADDLTNRPADTTEQEEVLHVMNERTSATGQRFPPPIGAGRQSPQPILRK